MGINVSVHMLQGKSSRWYDLRSRELLTARTLHWNFGRISMDWSWTKENSYDTPKKQTGLPF
jgi:hypothetical protein